MTELESNGGESSAPTAMSDLEMEHRLGRKRGKAVMVSLPEAIYRWVDGMWEPYPNSGAE